ncbi:MAG: 50S ribosomal protein L1, partial [bacterium]
MADHGKRYLEIAKKVTKDEMHEPAAAFALVGQTASTKFPETVDLAVRLGVDPRKGEQMVRGVTTLPHGTGKSRNVAVLAKGDLAEEAKAAGADTVGDDDLVAKITEGWRDFDVLVASEEMAPVVARLGRQLGPRTPNKKNGTVTNNIQATVDEIKRAARVEYRIEKGAIIHMPIGKASWDAEKLHENFNA